ncbi:16S rRNA methyltransferase [Thioclava dalianensis]|uniref:Ribosomal RNA small subunit methyltransferase E n=1 Tax=Thioclava dalianensis TaxID=1185766 RepID=A0A074TCI7_9RHOB|nr:16S rRNA (uracil(1498)-N(3))-methyltransferase [Thioclava dalianensis]KEP69409.1 16S rRNA methyltransferase [Thioclava dalianensis]SFN03223.1 16S rRNA (uracil1498-N3)-methyltransferase [Thioclava dalianensis]
MERAKIRLSIEHPLGPGQAVPLEPDQAHYLFAVMRLEVGARVALFNGRDGEWTAEVVEAHKKRGILACVEQAAPQLDPPDLWLLFSPIKKERTDFIVEKACELGCARVLPVQSAFTNSARIRQDRLQAHAKEAAEQCLGTFVPPVEDLQPLAKLLEGWDPSRRILWADEALVGPAQTLADLPPGPWAILIGPEGGFSPAERASLRALPFVTPISLGPRILRADTAVCAAITLWQSAIGDWT